jgi:hypothetical protein
MYISKVSDGYINHPHNKLPSLLPALYCVYMDQVETVEGFKDAKISFIQASESIRSCVHDVDRLTATQSLHIDHNEAALLDIIGNLFSTCQLIHRNNEELYTMWKRLDREDRDSKKKYINYTLDHVSNIVSILGGDGTSVRPLMDRIRKQLVNTTSVKDTQMLSHLASAASSRLITSLTHPVPHKTPRRVCGTRLELIRRHLNFTDVLDDESQVDTTLDNLQGEWLAHQLKMRSGQTTPFP